MKQYFVDAQSFVDFSDHCVGFLAGRTGAGPDDAEYRGGGADSSRTGDSASGSDTAASRDNGDGACRENGNDDGRTREAGEKEGCEEDDPAAGNRQIDRQRYGAGTLSRLGAEGVPPSNSVR